MPLFALTIYWHWSLNGCTNHGHKSTDFMFVDNSLLKKKILSTDHNGDSKQWHEWPPIVNSILAFVKPWTGEKLSRCIYIPAPPPPHSVLFRVRICSFPLFESTPYLRTANIFEPPFRGIFPALETPLNQEKCSMYPPKFGIVSQESKEMREKKKKKTLFKEISG